MSSTAEPETERSSYTLHSTLQQPEATTGRMVKRKPSLEQIEARTRRNDYDYNLTWEWTRR